MTLTREERSTYQWQMWVPEFGESGQQKLKNSTVLVSRIGGLGGLVAYELAAAGIGRLILAHAGNIKHSDLNRQLLMTHGSLGTPRVHSAKRRLLELNPRLKVTVLNENVNAENVEQLADKADVIVDCAPLFEERFLLNRLAVERGKPMVDCAMFNTEVHMTTIVPGKSPCLNCLYPSHPPAWRREFPVFGAVSGTVACLGAMETIKWIAGIGEPLIGQMLTIDLGDMSFRKIKIKRDPDCATCSH